MNPFETNLNTTQLVYAIDTLIKMMPTDALEDAIDTLERKRNIAAVEGMQCLSKHNNADLALPQFERIELLLARIEQALNIRRCK